MLGIITAVKEERDAVLNKMTGVQASRVYDIEFYEGKINNLSCIMAMSGIGKVNAARCTQLMIDRFKPKRVINVGSAGALNPRLNIGDVVVSDACVQHDVDLTIFGAKKGAFQNGENGFIDADRHLVELCKKAMKSSVSKEFNVFVGPVATGDQFYNSPEIKKDLFKEFGAYCDDMEGAAIAQVCKSCNVPFVVIRSISDKPEKETELMYFDYNVLASERCANFLVVLSGILVEKAREFTI